MDKLCQSADCTGCFACKHICHTQAIKIQKINKFNHPFIETNECDDCGRCTKTCPILTPIVKHEPIEAYYSAIPEEERQKSSSGGVFYALAKYIIEEKKGYVCGCVINNLNVEHIVSNKMSDIERMRGSKYIESDTKNCFKEIKTILRNKDNTVLFSGTPCQVAGLKKFLVRDYQNLICIDLFCNHVENVYVFHKLLDELKENIEHFLAKKIQIIDFNFRDKERYYDSFGEFSLTFKCLEAFPQTNKLKSKNFEYINEENIVQINQTQKIYKLFININQSYFYKIYNKNFSTRESCTNCLYTTSSRVGDISLGDIRGIKNIEKILLDHHGNSIVFLNTDKGLSLFKACEKAFQKNKKLDLEEAKFSQPCLYKKIKTTINSSEFINTIKYTPITQYLKENVCNKKDVAILNFVFENSNYGAVLTAYALNRFLELQGFNAVTLDYRAFFYMNNFNDENPLFMKFKKEFISMTHPLYFKDDLRYLNEQFSHFIVGSDQVFNPDFIGQDIEHFLLSFAHTNKNKIAYAASIGKQQQVFNEIIESDKNIKLGYPYFANRLNKIFLRETSAEKLLQNIGVQSDGIVADPVFLLAKTFTKEYQELIQKSNFECNSKYIAVYIVFKESLTLIKQLIEKSPQLSQYKIITLDSKKHDPKDFLKIIKNAELILTDSYHGMCFSIIFNKEFFMINLNKTALIRIMDLIDYIDPNLRKRVIDSIDKFNYILDLIKDNKNNEIQIDYDYINQQLDKFVNKSSELLLNSLNNPQLNNEIKNSQLQLEYKKFIKKQLLKVSIKKIIHRFQSKKYSQYKEKKQKLKRIKRYIMN